MSWLSIRTERGQIHIIPKDDTREHEESCRCWCKPNDYENMLVHKAHDKREEREKGILVNRDGSVNEEEKCV